MSAPRPGVGQAVGLAPEDERERAAQVGVRVAARSASTRAATIRMPLLAEPGQDVGRGGRGERHGEDVPALARIAFGLNRSVRGEAAITASAPGAVGASAGPPRGCPASRRPR